MKKAIMFIHGQGGNYQEVEQYKQNCPGFDMFGIDYQGDLPWIVQKQIRDAYETYHTSYDQLTIIANSIGAYFVMLALQDCSIEKALFISPILDMERLILHMMTWAGVTEEMLYEKKTIKTNFNETLSWEYLTYVRTHLPTWTFPTEILYGEHDHLTSSQTVTTFINTHNARLTIMNEGEHWFHTDEQLAFLNSWMKASLKIENHPTARF